MKNSPRDYGIYQYDTYKEIQFTCIKCKHVHMMAYMYLGICIIMMNTTKLIEKIIENCTKKVP